MAEKGIVPILANDTPKYNAEIIVKSLVYSCTILSENTIDIPIAFVVGYILLMTFSSNSPKTTPKTTAYLRVSTIDQDIEKNKAAILALANHKLLGHVTFVEEKLSGKVPWRKRNCRHPGYRPKRGQHHRLGVVPARQKHAGMHGDPLHCDPQRHQYLCRQR
jgi:hypothetical protein